MLETQPSRAISSGMFDTSETIGKLSEALAKAQAILEGASMDRKNPHFNSKYADLASVWDACRKPLADNGLAVVQIPQSEGTKLTVTTILSHASGEWIKGSLTMEAAKNTPQAIGSCITYARRYALAAFVGVAPEDDDGNEASAPQPPPSKPKPPMQHENLRGQLVEAIEQSQGEWDRKLVQEVYIRLGGVWPPASVEEWLKLIELVKTKKYDEVINDK